MTKKILALIFFTGLVSSIGVLTKPPQTQVSRSDCITKTEERTVRGDSMAGVLEEGDKVKIAFGFYNCHNIERRDLVVYQFTQSEVLIKRVHGVPGDRFSLRKMSDGYWRLIINGDIQKTSEWREYLFDENTKKILSLYEDSYHGIIPDDAYLILGNVATGSVDSTRFGLVGRGDIVAKVIVDK